MNQTSSSKSWKSRKKTRTFGGCLVEFLRCVEEFRVNAALGSIPCEQLTSFAQAVSPGTLTT